MVIQGHFQPGERIREIPLAATLKVSRIPLRLALERLAHEGFLDIRPTRGFVVSQFTTEDIYDSIELRGALEGTAARLAAERLRDDRAIAPLRDVNAKMDVLVKRHALTLETFTSYIEFNAKFHLTLLELSRSRMLKRAMERICCLPFASPSAFLLQQQTDAEARLLFLIAVDQHRNLIEAIQDHEGMRAETLAREHARLARRNLDRALTDSKLLRLVPGSSLIKL